jgi:integrase
VDDTPDDTVVRRRSLMADRWETTRTPGIFTREFEWRSGKVEVRYRARFRDAAGRSHSKNFARLEDAEKFLRKTRTQLDEGTLPDVAAGKITVAAFAEHFMETSTHLRPKSRELYDGWLRNHIIPAVGPRKLSSITKVDVRQFEAALVKRGKGKATVGGVHRLLHRMFEVAVDEDRVARNPVRGVKVERAQQREARFLDEEEVHRIAEEVPGRYRALVYTLSFTGIRIGEAAALRMRNLDLRAGTIRVTENSVELNGKKVLGPPKTTRSIRTADISPGLVATLKEHVATFAAPLDGDALVFQNEHGNAVGQSNFRKVFQSAAGRAGVEPIPRVHDLRHTAASFMARAGFTLLEAAQQLGHSTTVMTDRYSHVFPDARQAKIRRLDELFVHPALQVGRSEAEHPIGEPDAR